ncbi:MAG: hypothetical protein IIB12_09995 [Chloroflexi bacterium]|nr:hypothetical protein [Chloroflexota bacterium]
MKDGDTQRVRLVHIQSELGEARLSGRCSHMRQDRRHRDLQCLTVRCECGGQRAPGAPDGVTPDNRYFDVTPARLATAYVTEDGVVDRRWIAEKARTFRRARKLLGI